LVSLMSTHNFARLLIVATPILYSNCKAAKVAKVKLHGKYVCGIIIVHVISAHSQKSRQTDRHGKH